MSSKNRVEWEDIGSGSTAETDVADLVIHKAGEGEYVWQVLAERDPEDAAAHGTAPSLEAAKEAAEVAYLVEASADRGSGRGRCSRKRFSQGVDRARRIWRTLITETRSRMRSTRLMAKSLTEGE